MLKHILTRIQYTACFVVLSSTSLLSIPYLGAQESLKAVIEQMVNHYQVIITYDEETVGNLRVDARFNEEDDIETALKKILTPVGLKYKYIGSNYYVVFKSRPKKKQINIKPLGESRAVKKVNTGLVSGKKQKQHTQFFRLEALAPKLDRIIKGIVTDEEGNPLIGASIVADGTTSGTVTDLEGSFELRVADSVNRVRVSYVGYASTTVDLNGQTDLVIVLQPDLAQLDEVVVVGYGTMKKSDVTGAIVSLGEDDLTDYPAISAIQAIQGRAAGVTVQSTNGEPGSSYKIRIRGTTSINASSEPLMVVDGLVGAVMPPPEDIISIEILKDASATSIYGSRGANGVILVTTKSGKEGKVSVSVNTSYSFQKEIGRLDVLDGPDFAAYINEARNTDFYDLNNLEANTDWQELIFQPGFIHNNQLSFSGGSPKVKYYVSGVYYDQQGVVKTSAYDRLSLTTNLQFDISDRLNISVNSFLYKRKQAGVISQASHGGGNDGGVVTAAQRFEPVVGVLDENGEYTDSKVGIAPVDNPLAVIDGREIDNRQENLQFNVRGKWKITDNISFNSTLGYIFRNGRNGLYENRISNNGEVTNGSARLSNTRNFNTITEQYFNFLLPVSAQHKFDLTGGYSYQLFQRETFNASNTGFISDALGFWNLSAGSNVQIPNSGTSESEIASFYGRANYNFSDRILMTFTARYDGASQFSEGNKWAFFPSGALSWNVSNESFWNSELITNLKFRVSYGETGNQAIGPYESLARISPSFFVVNGGVANAVRPTSIANKDLTWETTSQFNLGTDIQLFRGRIELIAEYYQKTTRDLLFDVPVPSFSGYSNRLANIGKIGSKGFEFLINSRNAIDDFKWSTNFNLTINRSEVLSLPDGNDIIYAGAPGYLINGALQHAVLREGQPIGIFYGFIYDGVYQEGDDFIPGGGFETAPGGEKFRDLNNDGVLNNNDRTIIGDPNPTAVWGLSNDFIYGGFDLNVFFQAATGGDIINFAKMELDRLSGNSNATTDALDRWTPNHTETDIPKATAGRVSKVSTRFVEDGSYIRLKNLALGYNLSPGVCQKLRIANARIYVSGQNIWTLTDYSGVDPEVAYKSQGSTNSNINLGLDYGSYPSTKSITLGLNVRF